MWRISCPASAVPPATAENDVTTPPRGALSSKEIARRSSDEREPERVRSNWARRARAASTRALARASSAFISSTLRAGTARSSSSLSSLIRCRSAWARSVSAWDSSSLNPARSWGVGVNGTTEATTSPCFTCCPGTGGLGEESNRPSTGLMTLPSPPPRGRMVAGT